MNELSKVVLDYFKDKGLSIDEIMTQIDSLQIDVLKAYLAENKDDKVYVIKKSGTIEPFNKDKILRSIKNAADTKGQQLNTSDIDVIISDVEKQMKDMDRKVFKTGEIKEYVKRVLVEEGFSQVYDSYSSYIEI